MSKLCSTIVVASALLMALSVSACSDKKQQESAKPMDSISDPHSFANSSDVVVTHLDLDIGVDFDKKQIAGSATLKINNKSGADKLVLDTRDLSIDKVTVGGEASEAAFELGEEVKHLGRALTIPIQSGTEQVTIHYSTSPSAAALQWLEPSQTAGGKNPYLLTQSQAILARTWVPCQDTPAVRMTYRARVRTRPDLMAVMSATNPTSKTADGVYEFEMNQAIPSYLLALAVGDIEFRSLGPRSGVYSEPSVVERAAYEFADLEKMIEAAEKLYGPYRWERYDVIVLPPSFPFGGMENPRLTFATPTILAGDRSLVSLIAHELAHSWSGNLVTNATWNDFWLNEGFTTYFEKRIMEEVYGIEYREMLAVLGKQDLEATIKDLGGASSRDTHLYLDLAGRDPDDGMTEVAYEKGAFLLRMIEESVGRERFDAFLRKYFDTFAFQSMTTDRFVSYLRENLIAGDRALEEKLKLDAWIHGGGLPDNFPDVRSAEFDKVEAQVAAWKEGEPAGSLETASWTTQHWLHFIRGLPESMTKEQMSDLDSAFKFTTSGNSEILNAWFQHAIANGYEAAYPALEKFLTEMGRRKFLRPLYEKLAETPEGLERARRIYRKARPGYHAVSYNTVDQILKWSE